MKFGIFLIIVFAAVSDRPAQEAGKVAADENAVGFAATGENILRPGTAQTYLVKDGDTDRHVPLGMVYVPAGKFNAGTGESKQEANLDVFCIGKFSVTNAEYAAFLQATGSSSYPSYWREGRYPPGKANHPVVYISLTKARAYADWVSQQTGWKVTIPTSLQWEKAARGPNGYLYPWGNTPDTSHSGGVLQSKYNFNAVTAAHYLKTEPQREVAYDNRKSKYYGTKTTVEKIAGYDDAGHPTYLSVGANGSVRGWVSHSTYTGFIYTDLFTSLNAAGGNTSPVGSYESGKSGYGCYDMAGNVWNWCDTTIVATNGAEKGKTVNEIRGGSWYANGNSCRCISIGEGRAATGAYNTVGFRIVATLPPTSDK